MLATGESYCMCVSKKNGASYLSRWGSSAATGASGSLYLPATGVGTVCAKKTATGGTLV